MKLLLLIPLLFLGACAIGPGKGRTDAAKESEATGNERPYIPPVQASPETSGTVSTNPLDSLPAGAIPVIEFPAWGDKHQEWSQHLFMEVMRSKIPDNVKTPCKRLGSKLCTFQLISIMAKYESSFKPETSYNETGHLAGVVSRGLLQISKDSANGYGCNITDAKQLHNPLINLSCAVKIVERWAIKDGTIIDEPKKGCARYWSVCRKSSGSYVKIMKYMEKY